MVNKESTSLGDKWKIHHEQTEYKATLSIEYF